MEVQSPTPLLESLLNLGVLCDGRQCSAEDRRNWAVYGLRAGEIRPGGERDKVQIPFRETSKAFLLT